MTPLSLYAALTLLEKKIDAAQHPDADALLSHALAVLDLVFCLSVDLPVETYVSALFHDVLDASLVSSEQLLAVAGEEVWQVVRHVSASTLTYHPSHPLEDQHVRQLLLGQQMHPYLLIIHLADTLCHIESGTAPQAYPSSFLDVVRRYYLPLYEEQLFCIPYIWRHGFLRTFQKLQHLLATLDTRQLSLFSAVIEPQTSQTDARKEVSPLSVIVGTLPTMPFAP